MIPQLLMDLMPNAGDFGCDDRDGAFWSIEDDDELEAFLFEELLPGLYGQLSDGQWVGLPVGYRPLVDVLEFEQHCRYEGWTAVKNRASQMGSIIAGYEFLGLADEVRALTAVVDAYRKCAADGADGAIDAMSSAYRSVPNRTPEVEDRMAGILTFVRQHPQHFRE